MPAPLVAAIVRGVASQGIKKGIAQGAKQFAKDKIKDVAKKKAKSFIENKKDKDGGLVKKSDDGGSGGGFFGSGGGGRRGGGGGALIKSKKIDVNKLSLISNEKNDGSDKKDQSKPFTGEELIQELNKIKDNLVKLKEISSNNLANSIKNNSLLRRQREKAKRDEKEEKLESNKKGSEKPKSTKGIKGPGFLDLIWGFISNVLLGSLVVFLLKHAPTIIKLFKDIAKGLQNPLYALKIGITTLTTLFPKQIKFLAKLTGKILGPPARLIGNLLLKASNVLGNLFKKAGTAIINLVKNPIKNLAKRILGQAGTQAARSVSQFVAKKAAPAAANAAGKAAGAAGQALNVVKRLKFLSKALKNVHVVGALIGIGIDLALGERVDVAAAGAVGSALGSGIGLALGKGGALAFTISTGGLGILAAPIIIGASTFIGGAVGDWIGKEIYKKMAGIQSSADKAAPVNAKQGGGGSNSTVAMARARGRSGQTPQAAPAVSASKLSPKTQENAEKNIFKDEKHLNVFSEIREKLKISSFVGELLQLGADMAIGEKVNKTRTDIAAQQIGSSIGRALSENQLQVFGFNKKLIGPFSEQLTKWAKGKIFKDLTSISFPSYDKAKEESSSNGTTPDQSSDPNDPGSAGPGATLPGNAPPEIKAFMEAIAGAEGGWNSVNPRKVIPNLTGMTISQAREAGMRQRAIKGSGALGAFQQIPVYDGVNVLKQRTELAGLNYETDLFSPENQTKITRAYLASLYSGEQKLVADLKKDPMIAARKLRGVWPSLPGGSQQNSHTKGFLDRYNKSVEKYRKAQSSGTTGGGGGGNNGGGRGGNNPNAPSAPGSHGPGGENPVGKKIYLHWSGSGSTSSKFGHEKRYHRLFTGDGKPHQITHYNQKTPDGHTLYRNHMGVGIAVAGGGDNVPISAKQYGAMAQEAASLAKTWGWKSNNITVQNVATHAEVGSMKDGVKNSPARYDLGAKTDPDNYGPKYWGGEADKVDLHKLYKNDPDGSGGDKIRSMIKSKMSAMGVGGGGNRGPVNKSTLMGGAIGGTGAPTPSKNPAVDVSSHRGWRSSGMHQGVDIVPKGKDLHMPLYLPLDAKIVDSRVNGKNDANYGNSIYFTTSDGITHLYAHMKSPSRLEVGKSYPKGTLVGYMGYTGKVRPAGPDGTHLHWETGTKESDVGRKGSSLFDPLSKYSKFAPFTKSGTSPDPSLPIDPSSPGPGQSPGSPDVASQTSEPPKDLSWIDPDFNITGGKVKESYLEALRSGSYTGKPQDTQSVSQTVVSTSQSVSQRTDSIMQTPAYANNGGNNVLVMPMGGSSPQQSMPSGGGVNSGGGFVGSGDLDNYNKSLNQIVVSSLYKI